MKRKNKTFTGTNPQTRNPHRFSTASLVCKSFLTAAVGFCLSSVHAAFTALPIPANYLTAKSSIHPVNVLGRASKDVLVVNDSTVHVFSLGQTGFQLVQSLAFPLPEEKGQRHFYGFARLQKDAPYSLMVQLPKGVAWYPIENGLLSPQPQILFAAPLASSKSSGPAIQYFDMSLDLNDDGIDEILLPEENGFSITYKNSDQSYKKVSLPRNAFKETDSFRFSTDIPDDPVRVPFITGSLSRKRGITDLLFFDANNDNKLDLIYTSTHTSGTGKEVERYDVFLQENDFSFGAKPSQSIGIPYDSSARVTFRDINTDGKLDAVLVHSNFDIVNPRTIVKFFIGSGENYQVFEKESDRFVTKDPIGLVQLADFNYDKVPDFVMTYFSYQFGSMEDIVDLAFSSKLRFRLRYFLGKGKQGYSREPVMEKEITLNMKMEDMGGSPPVSMVEDMNGDGFMDLVVRSSATQLDVYTTQGKLAFPAKPTESFRIPEGSYLSFEDINGDGLSDIIVSAPAKQYLTVIFGARK